MLDSPAVDPALWPLDPDVVFLNHGSFGSCPQAVLARQDGLRRRLERQPVRFMVRELEGLLNASRHALAGFVGAEADDLVLIPNATTGVNAVLRSLSFEAGDELLVTDHEYNACRNVLNFVAERSGARVVVAKVPFPLRSADDFTGSVMAAVTPRTRLALIDHVTSQTGLVLPVAEIVRRLSARGVEVLVDGAHAPGMVPLDLQSLGAAFYTANCHKWMCAPKGAAFLHVRRDLQPRIRPTVISHGANSPRTDRSRFQIEFAWMGTNDLSAVLSIPAAIDFMSKLLPGGWPAVMEHNRRLALAGREVLCRALGIEAPCPDGMIGSLASVPIPDADSCEPPKSALYLDPWQDVLMDRHRIEVPIMPWPAPPKRLLRISAQVYNSLPQYEQLAKGLAELVREKASPAR
ncbi:MAG TPA: aminotransferase [Verrucomicrobiales bacterium]|nr:aminotransferase [Verrucomicrobiales bacterium]